MAQPAPLAVEDASERTGQVWQQLLHDKVALKLDGLQIEPLADFLNAADQNPNRTSAADRAAIVKQAELMLFHVYPHFPFKHQIYGPELPSLEEFGNRIFEPLMNGLETLSETEFHSRMIEAFTRVRDAHTVYGAPSPYRGTVAFLPFLVAHYMNETGCHYLVTRVMRPGPDAVFHDLFAPGAEIVGWSGLPVEEHMNLVANGLPGGNFNAMTDRAAIHSTVRPLAFCQPPAPEEIPAATIEYIPMRGGEKRAIRIPWAVAKGIGRQTGIPNSAFSLSRPTEATLAYCDALHREVPTASSQPAPPPPDPALITALPDVFDLQFTGGPVKKSSIDLDDLVDKNRPNARLGYIRIRNFGSSHAPGFGDTMVSEFERMIRLLAQVAPDGLVIDIRGNPGGNVPAAERMIQMLTPRRVAPVRFHLANTPAILGVLRNLEGSAARRIPRSVDDDIRQTEAAVELEAWLRDAGNQPLPDGPLLTSGNPLTDENQANQIGQLYHGGIALLVDGLSYSAADIFAAGFQDHACGQIVGADATTGGGGGNVWTHAELISRLGLFSDLEWKALPPHTPATADFQPAPTMSLAFRRCSRSGTVHGSEIEDVGVAVDVLRCPDSVEDVLAGYPGLIRRACEVTGEQAPVQSAS